MRKTNGWVNALFTLIFIAVPALVLYYFFLKDWGVEKHFVAKPEIKWTEAKIVLSTGAIWGVAIGFIAYSLLFSFALIKFKVLSIDSISFSIPLALVLMSIFVTAWLPFYARALIVVALILMAFPMNMLVTKFKKVEIRKNRR